MRTNMLSILLIMSALLFSPCIALPQDNPWTIITTSGDTLRSCSLDHMDGERVQLVCGNLAMHLPVDSIGQLQRGGGSYAWTGAGIGTLAGVVIGGIIGAEMREKPKATGFAIDFGPGFNTMGGILAGGVCGFVVGGVIGAAIGGTEVHDLAAETHAAKLRIVTQLAGEQD